MGPLSLLYSRASSRTVLLILYTGTENPRTNKQTMRVKINHMKACRMGTVFLVHFEQNHMTVCFPPLNAQYNSHHWLSGIFSRAHSLKLEWLLHVAFVLLFQKSNSGY